MMMMICNLMVWVCLPVEVGGGAVFRSSNTCAGLSVPVSPSSSQVETQKT